MEIVVVPVDDLEDRLRRIVREEVAGCEDGGWLDAEAAARYLDIAITSLHNAVSSGGLPRHGERGHALRFRRADLDAYIENRGRR